MGPGPAVHRFALHRIRECDYDAPRMRTHGAYVYILASRKNGTLYVGMTTDVAKRVEAHKSGAVPGFTRRYGVKSLVWVERFDRIEEAAAFERRLKRWRRAWKIGLIEEHNPNWRDLVNGI